MKMNDSKEGVGRGEKGELWRVTEGARIVSARSRK